MKTYHIPTAVFLKYIFLPQFKLKLSIQDSFARYYPRLLSFCGNVCELEILLEFQKNPENALRNYGGAAV